MKTFREGNAITVTARFRASGAAVIPTTVHYSLRNVTVNRTLVDWTELTPGASVDIDLTAQQIAIAQARNESEILEITVVADKDTAQQMNNILQWEVLNLSAL